MVQNKGRFEDTFEFPFTKHKEFYRIALEGLQRAGELKRLHDRRRRQKPLMDDDTLYLAEMNGLIELAPIVAVVFAALTLEAFINDYARERLSKGYFENYLDKLDVIAKWIVLPRVILGKQLDPGGSGMNSLRWLVRLRNELGHYKSKVKTVSTLDWWKDWVHLEDAQRSCGTVPALLSELKKLDRSINTDWLASDYNLWPG
ncbi:MAG: hypothetical protein ACRD2B_12455 [Terriglobia bacterium]